MDQPKIKTVGDYEIEFNKPLGQGAHAKVYQCRSKKNQEIPLAAKIIELSSKRERIQIITQEDKMFKKLCKLQPEERKYILNYLEKEEDENFNYFFAEKCYVNLQKFLELLLKQMKTLNPIIVREFIYKIVQGYMSLIKVKITHRDLKPENILLTHNGPDLIPKISDFGVSTDNEGILSTKAGTANYCAPEIICQKYRDQNEGYSNLCDVFSLGVIYYYMIFGSLPFNQTNKVLLAKFFEDESNSIVVPEKSNDWPVPEEIRLTIQNMLKFNPKQRIEWQKLELEFKIQIEHCQADYNYQSQKQVCQKQLLELLVQQLDGQIEDSVIDKLNQEIKNLSNSAQGLLLAPALPLVKPLAPSLLSGHSPGPSTRMTYAPPGFTPPTTSQTGPLSIIIPSTFSKSHPQMATSTNWGGQPAASHKFGTLTPGRNPTLIKLSSFEGSSGRGNSDGYNKIAKLLKIALQQCETISRLVEKMVQQHQINDRQRLIELLQQLLKIKLLPFKLGHERDWSLLAKEVDRSVEDLGGQIKEYLQSQGEIISKFESLFNKTDQNWNNLLKYEQCIYKVAKYQNMIKQNCDADTYELFIELLIIDRRQPLWSYAELD